VYRVEWTVSIDKQGRLTIPAPIRELLGLKQGGKAIVRLEDNRIIIEVIKEDLEEKVDKWASEVLATEIEAKGLDLSIKKDKWGIDVDYVLRKLGLY